MAFAKRAVASLGLLLALAAAGRDADAGGSVYRGQGGAVPPGLREPTDPTPPPPPPPTSVPATEPAGPVLVPSTPTAPPPPPASPPGAAEAPRRDVFSFEHWSFWYLHNREAFEGRPGPEASVDRAFRERALAAIRESAMEPDRPFAIRAAALVALGKATDRVDDVGHLLATLADPAGNATLRESALLGLGLLRRSDSKGPFDGALYDRVRRELLRVAGSDDFHGRARAFAAVAVGLLGDQPTGSDPGSVASTRRALLDLLRRDHTNGDVPSALFHALAMQPPAEGSDEGLAVLRLIAREGSLDGRSVERLPRAHAVVALGRAGTDDDATVVSGLLENVEGDVLLRRSAACAAVHLAPRLSLESRVRLLDGLTRASLMDPDDSVRCFAVGASAEVLLAAPPAEVAETLRRTLLLETLMVQARYGPYFVRSFAALALGRLRAAKNVADLVESAADLRMRPALATAMGLAGDEAARDRLREWGADRKRDGETRGYATLALAYVAPGDVTVAPFVRAQILDRINITLRLLSVVASGLLRDAGAVEILRDELARFGDPNLQCESAAALARIGTPEAAETLLSVAADAKASPQVRAAAVAGLGRLLDREMRPSLSRFTLWMNYRASTDFLNEIYSIP